MPSQTVDILMATYNGERFVREQIESIQGQTFEDWRLLVSDDCSTDGTLGMVRDMAAHDPRIQVVSEGMRYGSAKANFMHLLSLSEAPYAMFCDQDDVWLPQKVERSLAVMCALEDRYGSDIPLLSFCDMRVVDDELRIIADSFEALARYDVKRLSFSQLLAQNVAAGCSMVVNRPLVNFAMRASTDDDIVMHDWWLMLVAAAFGHISYIDEQLSLYRQHGDNEVGANRFSPVDRASHQDFMEEQFRASVGQAKLFLEVYRSEIGLAEARSADEFYSISVSKSFTGGVYRLLRSGCLKAGVRKVGQIAMVARVVRANRTSGEAS